MAEEQAEEPNPRGAERGHFMSNYGLKTYTAEQAKEQWRESVKGESRCRDKRMITTCRNRDLCRAWKVEYSRYLSGEQPLDSISYFNNGKQQTRVLTYDRMFKIKQGYCSKLHRDDRQHTDAFDVHAEECEKAVPVLTSSQYGRRPPLETPQRKHVRVATVKRDFYRYSGTNIPLTER
ncbi:uncharacterized protein LOC5518058 [Nematostella vectensis]|uniref:uncharacterized protein LOC5518058 n=1 Tax=Nematostella vectensis TaxID=45351 RepID=UPI0020778BE7|nr:uncharacterized protein LOC5518058 [Nematostella vectensis]